MGEWTDKIGTEIVAKMREVNQYFKYVVSTIIVQKVGAGLHVETVCSWDKRTDGSISVKFENDSLSCITLVVGLAF